MSRRPSRSHYTSVSIIISTYLSVDIFTSKSKPPIAGVSVSAFSNAVTIIVLLDFYVRIVCSKRFLSVGIKNTPAIIIYKNRDRVNTEYIIISYGIYAVYPFFFHFCPYCFVGRTRKCSERTTWRSTSVSP